MHADLRPQKRRHHVNLKKTCLNLIQHTFITTLTKTLRAQEGPALSRAKRDNRPSQKHPIITGHRPSHRQVILFPVNLKISKTLNKPSPEIFLDGLLPLYTSGRSSRVVVLRRKHQLRGFPWSSTSFCSRSTNIQAERQTDIFGVHFFYATSN